MLLVLGKKNIHYINWTKKYRVTQIYLTEFIQLPPQHRAELRTLVVYSQKSTIGLLFKKTTQTCRKSVDKRNSHLTKSPFGVKFSFSISSKSNSFVVCFKSPKQVFDSLLARFLVTSMNKLFQTMTTQIF